MNKVLLITISNDGVRQYLDCTDSRCAESSVNCHSFMLLDDYDYSAARVVKLARLPDLRPMLNVPFDHSLTMNADWTTGTRAGTVDRHGYYVSGFLYVEICREQGAEIGTVVGDSIVWDF